MLPIFVMAAIAFRGATLALSTRNERTLQGEGGIEIGSLDSHAPACAHVRVRWEQAAVDAPFGSAA